ncbi:Manganese superoxide dismutase [Phytophthora megakarya]|uniref:Superoxide dismutase n=1 Tax=Phytophthora megakarya TaxID=4795 RepID=A0A225VTY4_9STRA|nr:Manganese superoxide dismutase [Phytophthora megakarya]
MSFELPKIAYEYNALEPFVDTDTMNIHHTKHHQAYVNNINNYISSDKGAALQGKSILEVVQAATEAPVRNNGGGHYNHSLFWTWMTSPGSTNTAPHGALKTRIDEDFGSLDQMKQEFNAAASSRFGSGWAWLGVKADGKLAITSTPNQDNPLMPGVDQPLIPILGLDVWEHAYYLKYQNRRPEYISAFWNVANWDKVVEYYDQFASKGKPVDI